MVDRTDIDEAIVAIVPARGGSKGLPGKNIRVLAGEPLYLRAVHQGLRLAPHCIVTTDIADILASRPPAGGQWIRRPANLALDDTPIDPVLAHALTEAGLTCGTAVLLQPTSPLRNDEDIRRAMTLFRTGAYDLVLSVCETDAGILKYGTLEDERFVPVSKPEYCFTNRQELPGVVRPNGAVYVFDIARFIAHESLASTRIGAILMPAVRSIDIDTQADLDEAERRLAIPPDAARPGAGA